MSDSTTMVGKKKEYSPQGLTQLRQIVLEAIEAERVRRGLDEFGYRPFAVRINEIAGEELYDKDAISRLVNVGLKRPRGNQKPDLVLLKYISLLENFPYTYEELKAIARGEMSLLELGKKTAENHSSPTVCDNLSAKVASEGEEYGVQKCYHLIPRARRRLKNWLEEYFRLRGYKDEEDFVDEACAAFGEQKRGKFRARFSSMLTLEDYSWNDAALEPLLLLGQVSWSGAERETPVLNATKYYESVSQVIAVLESNGINYATSSK